MTLLLKIVLNAIMALVKRIRGDGFHYLSAPNEVLSRYKVDRIMKIGHGLPSIVAACYIGLSVVPYFSETYAEKLERNEFIVPITIVGFLLPLFLLNGFLIEIYLEKSELKYREAKNQ